MDPLNGLIVRSQSGFYEVQTDQGRYACRLRGRLKKGPRVGDIIAIGDRVQITPLGGGGGVIEAIEPRAHMLSRMAPTPRGEYQQIIIANPDQAIFVFSCARPAPHLGMLDRYLVIAEKQSLPALIVANKVDLVEKAEADELFGHYLPLGYPVIYTSAKSGQGIDELFKALMGKISVFSGPSGVGKSTLLNRLIPDLDLHAREISRATSKGRHTTVVREMYPLENGGYVADTPGLKALALWDIEPEELDGYFPEMRVRVTQCAYNDCMHLQEPGCAVLAAVEAGEIHPGRYQSYVHMRLGEDT